MNSIIAGTGNLGRAVAYVLLKKGDRVIINARSEKRLIDAQEFLKEYGSLKYHVSDLSTDQGITDFLDFSVKELETIDNLIITLGGYAMDSIENPEHLDEMLEGHLKIPLNLIRHFSKSAHSGSTITLVSSIQAQYTRDWSSLSYVIGKNALNKLIELSAANLLGKGIRVNGVAVSMIESGFAPGRDWTSRDLGDPLTPPEGIAEVIAFLTRPESQCIDGAVIPVDSGSRFSNQDKA